MNSPQSIAHIERDTPWLDCRRGRTRPEIMARSKGLQNLHRQGRARTDLDLEQARTQVKSLPLPTFDADRRLVELDRMERGAGGETTREARKATTGPCTANAASLKPFSRRIRLCRTNDGRLTANACIMQAWIRGPDFESFRGSIVTVPCVLTPAE